MTRCRSFCYTCNVTLHDEQTVEPLTTRMPRTAIAKPKPKQAKQTYHRYAVRLGRVPGIYESYEQAKPQVEGVHACHMGFTKKQVRLGVHHYYMQQTVSDKQVRKLRELGEGGPLAERGDGSSTPYVPEPYSYYDVDRPGSPAQRESRASAPQEPPLLLK